MKNTIIIIVVLLVLGGGIYFAITSNSSDEGSPANTNTSSNTPVFTEPSPEDMNTSHSGTSADLETINPNPPAPTTPVSPETSNVSVNIKGFAFDSASLKVKVGTKVTWTNLDSVGHTVTSDSGSLLKSPTIAPGGSFSFTFTSAGTYSYHCAFHPSMKGSIVVGQ